MKVFLSQLMGAQHAPDLSQFNWQFLAQGDSWFSTNTRKPWAATRLPAGAGGGSGAGQVFTGENGRPGDPAPPMLRGSGARVPHPVCLPCGPRQPAVLAERLLPCPEADGSCQWLSPVP